MGGSGGGSATGAWKNCGEPRTDPEIMPNPGPLFGQVAFKSSRTFALTIRLLWTHSIRLVVALALFLSLIQESE